MLDYVLKAANSLSPSHDVTAAAAGDDADNDDDVISQQQQQLDDVNHNVTSDDCELVTPSTAGANSLDVIHNTTNVEVI